MSDGEIKGATCVRAAHRQAYSRNPHGGSDVLQERRRCSNFKYVLTPNQESFTITVTRSPSFSFPVWSLIRPQGEEAEPAPPKYSLYTFFARFLKQIWESVGTFEMSFHSKMGALISPLLRLTKKPQMINEDSCVTHRVLSASDSLLCRPKPPLLPLITTPQKMWHLCGCCPKNTIKWIIIPVLSVWKLEVFKNQIAERNKFDQSSQSKRRQSHLFVIQQYSYVAYNVFSFHINMLE